MESNNGRTYSFCLNGSNGKAVLLIHGITGTPSEMRYLGKSLHKEGFSVFCNALPRHCMSLSELNKVTWQEISNSCVSDFAKLAQRYEKVFVAGISMGALMAIHLSSMFPDRVCGIGALATTVFYDGWALHKGKFLMPLIWHMPFIRNRIYIRETPPYGLKDEELRGDVERFYKNARAHEFSAKSLLFGSPFFPMANLYQHHLFAKVVKKELPKVRTPILLIHAREDDMTSVKNARYVMDNIGSANKALVLLEDSYHMITIDREKERVARELSRFFHAL